MCTPQAGRGWNPYGIRIPSVYQCPIQSFCRARGPGSDSRCVHWWWAIAYTTRTVLSAPYGEVEYTQRTDLCTARITTMRRHSLAITTCAVARADIISAAHVCYRGRPRLDYLSRYRADMIGGARLGVIRGIPWRRDQSAVSAAGCVEPSPAPPPHSHADPQRPNGIGETVAPETAAQSRQSHHTSNFQIANNAKHISWIWEVSEPGLKLQASKTLSLNWQRLNHIVPLDQKT